MDPMQISALQKYMAQRGMGPRGGGGGAANPVGPGIADPYTNSMNGSTLDNPTDAQNQFDPGKRRAPPPYMRMNP